MGPETRQKKKKKKQQTPPDPNSASSNSISRTRNLKQSTNLEVHSNGNSTACSLYAVATFSTPKGSDPPTPVGPDRWQSHWVVFCLISSTSCRKAAIRWAKKRITRKHQVCLGYFFGGGEKTYPAISLDAPPHPVTSHYLTNFPKQRLIQLQWLQYIWQPAGIEVGCISAWVVIFHHLLPELKTSNWQASHDFHNITSVKKQCSI